MPIIPLLNIHLHLQIFVYKAFRSIQKHKKELFVYIGAVLLSLIILIWVMQLWKADLSVPFGYYSDALFILSLCKGMLESGWYLSNSFVGAPFGLSLHDFPLADSFSFLLIKLLALIVTDYAVVLNIFYLLTFPLITLSALCVFRQFRISVELSFVGSLLFTFLPYHFLRGVAHLFLSAYYGVPLVVMVMLWVYSETPFLFRDRFKSIASIMICLVVASSGIYYSFFACFLLLIAGISASYQHKRLAHFGQSGILILIICTGSVANLLPNLLYIRAHGKNPQVVVRLYAEAEIHGLKIIQMLLPISSHRIQRFAEKTLTYNQSAPLVAENMMSSLGGIGSIGFLCLIGRLFYQRNVWRKQAYDKEDELLNRLSVFNIFAVLLGTIGGFGAVFAYFISQNIRAYNRISIYIAFFSLFALCLLLDQFVRHHINSRRMKFFFDGCLCVLLITGILDQTSPSFVPDYAGLQSAYRRDADFIRQVEASVPEGTMVFQLPYHPFPEFGWTYQLLDYDHFRGYLHSKYLKWSYGAMKGRKSDLWQQWAIAKPISEFVKTLAFAGFTGIYLDRRGYADRGMELESKLSTLLNVTPITSPDQNLLFFSLIDYITQLKHILGEEQWQIKKTHIFDLILSWEKGFFPLEGIFDENNWRWCSAMGELHIINQSQHAQLMTFEMNFSTGYGEFFNLTIESALFPKPEYLKVNSQGTAFSKTVSISPGEHIMTFFSDAPALKTDSRIVFRMNNFQLYSQDER